MAIAHYDLSCGAYVVALAWLYRRHIEAEPRGFGGRLPIAIAAQSFTRDSIQATCIQGVCNSPLQFLLLAFLGFWRQWR